MFFKFFKFFILEREEGRKEERMRNINWLPPTCTPGDWTCNPGMCLIWNQTCDLSICGTISNQLSHTGQGKNNAFYVFVIYLPFYDLHFLKNRSILPSRFIFLLPEEYPSFFSVVPVWKQWFVSFFFFTSLTKSLFHPHF